MGPQHRIVSSFAIIIDRSPDRALQEQIPDSRYTQVARFSAPRSKVSVLVEQTAARDSPAPVSTNDHFQSFALGDCQDAVTGEDMPFLGNGIVVRARATTHELEIFSSITGLPATFLYRDADITVVA